MSGNRWSARSKGRARRLGNDDSGFDRAIDGDVGKFDRQCRRRRGERGAHRGDGHADRAEIVGPVIGGMVLGPIAIRCADRCDQEPGTLSARPAKRVNVTKGHGKVDGDRDEREP